ncbi:MAG: 4Fe-4S dicluster domain-containing protein [Deltaproteobacteria bacterium]|jgi:formate dehydrogenase beta subunit|nr:4Fe-4S dicluster domain-containing protein [Deltaproteobacteria bacterium]MDX9760692.1 4Fe-4S dicluster domain-containing protein [Desulfomonilia bacterium]HPW68642.1 4Fe-4S dicluster domain-containing protein [Deltaproteobacteria bacterium]
MKKTEYIKLIDTTKCTACRGCQVACKQWNEMPAMRTRNFGSYQNPPDLQWNTWTLIRFQEHVDKNGDFKWLFRKDGCMHCTEAACIKVCPSGALYHTEYGTVGINQKLCIGCKACISACPFDIPRFNQQTEKIYKCDLCYDRLKDGQQPACALSCPTGAITVGEREAMIDKAYGRLDQLEGKGIVYGDKFVGGTHVMYILSEDPAVYDKLPVKPRIPASVILWKNLFKPFTLIGMGAVAGMAALHYLIKGPHEVHENKEGDE